MEKLGKCAVPGCDNSFDPRWFVHINGRAEQACDGHGCTSGDPCKECKRDGAAWALADKVTGDIGEECNICHDACSTPFGLEPTPICNECAQEAARVLAEYAIDVIAANRADYDGE